MKLNIGCGDNKIKGYINIDSEKACNPDLLLCVVKNYLPYENDSVSEILFFHCIEHIEKRLHRKVFTEFSRVLKKGGKLYLSYPNFWACAQNWNKSVGEKRRFWEATIYGRQLYKGDYHVCIIDPYQLADVLYDCGFTDVHTESEPKEVYNMVTVAIKKGEPLLGYEEAVVRDLNNMIVKKGEKVCV